MDVHAWNLGATLYMPATRDDLIPVVLGNRQPDLRSAVICLEDAVHPSDVPLALARLQTLLARLAEHPADMGRPALFVRPRDATMLAHILRFRGIEAVDGFVIPKATADSLPAYLAVLAFDHHVLMPTLETREVFDPAEMRRLREQLTAIHERILAVRIGGNDLLQTLGARRSAQRTVYDGPLGSVIANLVATYAPWGFALSAPVFEHFGNMALLREEVERDLDHGLVTKTAIHPSQIAVIQSVYAVDDAIQAEAHKIISDDVGAVFSSRQAMCEPATHRLWAQATLRRAEVFGVTRTSQVTPISA
jgi:citrate lyase beta subunit